MTRVAAVLAMVAACGLASPAEAAMWYEEKYEVPPYTGDGDIPGNHITDHGWVGTSVKRLEGYNAPGGAAGSGCIWAMGGGQGATLLADPTNSHTSAQERVSVWVWTRSWSYPNIPYYMVGHVRSTPDGTYQDVDEAAFKVAYKGDGTVNYLQRDPVQWVTIGTLPAGAHWVQFVWDINVPTGQGSFNVYDDQGVWMMGTSAPADLWGTAPTSAVNGIHISVAPTAGQEGWTGWDNLVFETIPEPASAALMLLGLPWAIRRRGKAELS